MNTHSLVPRWLLVLAAVAVCSAVAHAAPEDEKKLDTLLQQLSAQGAAKRLQAIRALGQLGDVRAVGPLMARAASVPPGGEEFEACAASMLLLGSRRPTASTLHARKQLSAKNAASKPATAAFGEVMSFVRDVSGVNLYVDLPALGKLFPRGLPTTSIEPQAKTVAGMLCAALRKVGKPGQVGFLIEDGIVVVSTVQALLLPTPEEIPLAGAGKSPAAAGVRKLLAERKILRLDFVEIELKDIVSFLCDVTDLNLFVHWPALKDAGVAYTTGVTVDLQDLSVARTLEMVLRATGAGDRLAWAVDSDGEVIVATRAALRAWPAVKLDAAGRPPAGLARAADRAARYALAHKLEKLSFAETPLAEALDRIEKQTWLVISVEWDALAKAGVSRNVRVDGDFRGQTVSAALDGVLKSVAAREKLGWVVQGGIVTVTTNARVRNWESVRIERWITLLKSKEPGERARAASLLMRIDPLPDKAVAPLLAALGRLSYDLQKAVASAVGKRGVAAMPALMAAMRADPNGADTSVILDMLIQIGAPAVPALMRELADRDSPSAWRAMHVLARIGPPAAGPLVGALKGENRTLARRAADTLAEMGKEARPFAAALKGALGHKDELVRLHAAGALVRIGADPRAPLALLLRGLANLDDDVRKTAVLVVGEIGLPAKEAIPALLDLCEDRNEWVRRRVAAALAAVGPADPRTVPALVKLLRADDELFVRAEAAEALGEIGPAAKAALSALRQATKDKSDYVRDKAADAIKKIQKPPK